MPITHDNFSQEIDVKAVSGYVHIPPLLRQRHNAALGLLYKSSIGPRSNLSLRPLAWCFEREVRLYATCIDPEARLPLSVVIVVK